MARVAQMPYQLSYENAAKGIIKLKTKATPPPKHGLAELFAGAGIVLRAAIDNQHLTLLTRMNELGRYRLTRKDEYHTTWTTQFREHRAAIDAAIAEAWLTNCGAHYLSDITGLNA